MASIPRIAVLLPLLSAACATTYSGREAADCGQGQADACSTWGYQLLDQARSSRPRTPSPARARAVWCRTVSLRAS